MSALGADGPPPDEEGRGRSAGDPGAAGEDGPADAAEAPPGDEPSLPAWAERAVARDEPIIPLTPGRPAPPPSIAEPPRSGILVVDKPGGMTSHDVVQAVRRASGERRVGHAGTLDPMATGVLVVCLGSATRVVEEVQAGAKGYRARITLGRATSTYDAEGEVTETADAAHIGRAAVEAALEAFRGDIRQVPPMVSALKHEGRRLYDLARAGIEVERPARPVTVHALALVDWSPPDLTLELTVSSGTYVRSIAHDLGRALGVGGHLSALRRTFVGPFGLADAFTIPRIVEAFAEGWWPSLLHPLDAALMGYDALVVDEGTERAMRDGQQFEGPAPRPGRPNPGRARVYEASAGFVGLARWDALTARWQPERVFPRPGGRP